MYNIDMRSKNTITFSIDTDDKYYNLVRDFIDNIPMIDGDEMEEVWVSKYNSHVIYDRPPFSPVGFEYTCTIYKPDARKMYLGYYRALLTKAIHTREHLEKCYNNNSYTRDI